MMTIDEEVHHLIAFLSHPAGFNVDFGGLLCIRPVCEDSPPKHWAVDWNEMVDGVSVSIEKVFPDDLAGAAQFFVEKRRYLVLGLDFEKILWENNNE